MHTAQLRHSLTRLWNELVEGIEREAFVLNSGDAGLLRSLDALAAADASRSVDGGATIAAHAQHVRYGLSLMNRWALEGGDPFMDAKWELAWKISKVGDAEWAEIRKGLGDEARRWRTVLDTPRETADVELTGMIASLVHIAYHLGAIRQIAKGARGPKEGTYV